MSFFRIAIWRASRRPGSRSLATDAHIPLSYAAICVWGANTGVGKTLVSAGLAAAVARAEVSRVDEALAGLLAADTLALEWSSEE